MSKSSRVDFGHYERIRRRLLLSVVSVGVLAALLGPMASGALASHFRSGNLSWQKSGSGTGFTPVTFQNTQSWRASAFGNPAVGSVIANSEGCIDYGDGSQDCPNYLITFNNAGEDYLIMRALAPGSSTDFNVPHTYTGSGPFTATTTSCCTISTLNNAHDQSWNVRAFVDLVNDDESARSTVPPIVQLPAGGVQTYTVPAIDAGGETKRFRLSDANESCVGCGDPQPPGLTINPNTGQVSWDTTGKDSGSGLWWTGVVVESLVGGNVVSNSQVQYIIRVGGAALNASPVWDDTVTPADGTVFSATPGDTITFSLKANDPDAGDTVQIRQNSGPGTLTPADGNPATASYSYVVQPGDVGTDQTIQFFAQDNGSPPLGPPFRSYTIHVTSGGTGGETLYLDSFNANNAQHQSTVTSAGPLPAGAPTVVTVDGTASKYAPKWSKGSSTLCGAPEIAPLFASTGTPKTGEVGVDPEFLFARPVAKNTPCPAIPQHRKEFQISTDGGTTWKHLEPTGGAPAAPTAGHLYTYSVTGTGVPVKFRYLDTVTSDNYGMFRITIGGAPMPKAAKSRSNRRASIRAAKRRAAKARAAKRHAAKRHAAKRRAASRARL